MARYIITAVAKIGDYKLACFYDKKGMFVTVTDLTNLHLFVTKEAAQKSIDLLRKDIAENCAILEVCV